MISCIKIVCNFKFGYNEKAFNFFYSRQLNHFSLFLNDNLIYMLIKCVFIF